MTNSNNLNQHTEHELGFSTPFPFPKTPNTKKENQPQFKFTLTEIITKIAHWEHEPFTLEEQNFLLKIFTSPDNPQDNPTFTFGENNIESFILDTLSELENQ